ncbi:MAG: hypothetical protein AUJ92_11135 [Armatimonadetes bacterium CG2_30_59_28]|nr:PQQ-binding-like beta-propeller repeat protein [Armatimonadota bacterium]OIO94007.1 MAG: hypothetical protein AUJ92_11135 [Armatimonadetes bacterium CG2_30_59_28]PIU62401.1 MAG: polyvinylalcohol dehydrogenase [Armatimonadetes bacterium CG07_land_8_20_14_0_80_59_28]PIX44408.1 MAG: polyvinylalcohol dehydrogenase [Armatimonadetes bacterium CG_4_8_14_3_um_filter_58_9]PIY48950.1 MAG: polyvinylalcohol dehydrogenase [Armatimonadetes bacterium CG_4_10_14_3_um_filter_59_10]
MSKLHATAFTVTALATVYIGSILAQTSSSGLKAGDSAVVVSDTAPALIGNEIIAQLKKGEHVRVVEVRESWAGVEFNAGGQTRTGWVEQKHLQKTSVATPPPVPAPTTPTSPLPEKSGEWTQWRGPNRDGKSPDVGLLKTWPQGGPPQGWRATGIGVGYSSVAVSNGTVYISGDIGDSLMLTALDTMGKKKWQVRHGPSWNTNPAGSRGSPVVDSGRVYLLSAQGLLNCYDAPTGAGVWQVDLKRDFGGVQEQWGYSESPLIYGNLLIVTPGGRNCIVALNKATGQPVWGSTGLADTAHHASAIAVEFQGLPMIVQMLKGGMVAADARNGRFLWRCARAVGGAACASPVYSNGYCFGATGYNNGGACVRLQAVGGTVQAQPLWETKDMICHHGGYVIHDGYIYGNHLEGWSCLELGTGRVMWNARGVGKGSLCFADGMLYTFSERGGQVGLVQATPQGFQQTGQFAVSGQGQSWAYPVVIGGRLYLRYGDNLYCYDVRGADFKS